MTGASLEARFDFEPLGTLLGECFNYTRQHIGKAVRLHGVTAPQLGVLSWIMEEPGTSGAEVARRMHITPQAAQLSLRDLERKGLVERTPDPSGRKLMQSFLTEKGETVLASCVADVKDVYRELLGDFSTEERAMFQLGG